MEFFNKYKNDFYRAIQRVAKYVKKKNIRYEDIPKIQNDIFLSITQDLLLDFEKNDNLKLEVLYAVQRLYEENDIFYKAIQCVAKYVQKENISYERIPKIPKNIFLELTDGLDADFDNDDTLRQNVLSEVQQFCKKSEKSVSAFMPANVQPMKLEQEFLFAMLYSKVGELFMEDTVKKELDAVLTKPEQADSFIEKDLSWERPLQEQHDKILTIMQAIDANVWIQDMEGNLFLPYKIRYSLRWKTFELLAETEGRTVILRNLNELSDLKLTEKEDANRKTLENMAEMLLAEETVILQVNHHRPDILDRCFALLRQHERFGYLLNKTGEGPDIYRFEIRYLKQEEDQLIQDILSLNDAVVVKSPERIRNLVIEEWKRVASYYV